MGVSGSDIVGESRTSLPASFACRQLLVLHGTQSSSLDNVRTRDHIRKLLEGQLAVAGVNMPFRHPDR